jgi:hypothetical protein
MAEGEWVGEFPDRPIHGYRISQLVSSKVDPGEILEEYRATRFPDRFYKLKNTVFSESTTKLIKRECAGGCLASSRRSAIGRRRRPPAANLGNVESGPHEMYRHSPDAAKGR